MHKVFISPVANEDIQDIKRYIIIELNNPTAALNAVSKITKRIRELGEFPALGTSLDSVINFETDYRFLICGSYTVFYRVVDNTIFVDRVLYGKRDFMKALFEDTRGYSPN